MNSYNFNQPPYPSPQYQPYNLYNQSNQQLIRVTGIEGAKAYQMDANSTVALFDNNEDLMYIKTTDGAGFPSIRCFEFKERIEKTTQNVSDTDFISRKEFDEFKKEIMNYGKQFISEQSINPNKPERIKSSKTNNE